MHKTSLGSTRLLNGYENLEVRLTPAQFGIPWSDPTHLTLSFAPDGTQLPAQTSELFATLDAQIPRAQWQRMVMRAFETWSAVANINVGIVSDDGSPIGSSGPTQGDARFGEIRVAGIPMDDDALAVSIPPGTGSTGSYAGDLFINTRQTFTPSKLYAVVLHEAGHIFGLDHSVNPSSIMFPTMQTSPRLTTEDVAAIQNLYGTKGVDLNAGSNGNDTFARASRIRYSVDSGGYDGSTPVIGFGDISSSADVDYLYIPTLSGYNGTLTLRVQSREISTLLATVTLLDRSEQVLETQMMSGDKGGVVTFRVDNNADSRYYLKIESKSTAVHSHGRYAVSATFDDLLAPVAISANDVMTGPYESLAPEKIDQLFKDPAAVLFEDDLHTNDNRLGAVDLGSLGISTTDKELGVTATISDLTDRDLYRLRAPSLQGNASWFLTLTTYGVGDNPIIPKLVLYDARMQRVNTKIIVNGNGSLAVEASSIEPRAAYYVLVHAPNRTGNYSLRASFRTAAAEFFDFSADTLNANNQRTAERTLYVGRSQLFNYSLSSSTPNANVVMTIRNSVGQVIFRFASGPGQTRTSISKLLLPGEYRVTFTSNADTNFVLKGSTITDPVGPVYGSPAYTPQYQPNPAVPLYVFPYNPTLPQPVPYLYAPYPVRT